MLDKHRLPWRFGVPLVCVLAKLLLAATHRVLGAPISATAMPRVWVWILVRAAQSSVSRLSSERDALASKIDGVHNRDFRCCI